MRRSSISNTVTLVTLNMFHPFAAFGTIFVLNIILFGNSAAASFIKLQDNFQDGTVANWGSPGGNTVATNVRNVGPQGVGDNAIDVQFNQSAVVLNRNQWSGDWTARGFHRITFDARSPTANAQDLTMWLGILHETSQARNIFVTSSSDLVPSDGLWHRVTFEVESSAWTSLSGGEINDALNAVSQLRIVVSPSQGYKGVTGIAGMQLDNITAIAIPEPATCILLVLSQALTFRRRRPD